MPLTRASTRTLALVLVAALAGCAPLGVFRPGTEDAPEVITVTMTDTSIDLSPALVARGKVGFEFVNDGQLEHAFQILGAGTDESSDEFLTPGQRRRVWVKLAPGTFRIFCPDGDHAKLGMTARLTVTDDARWFRR